jgi:hypothetical protein
MFHVKHITHHRFLDLKFDVSRETMLLPLLNLNSKKNNRYTMFHVKHS